MPYVSGNPRSWNRGFLAVLLGSQEALMETLEQASHPHLVLTAEYVMDIDSLNPPNIPVRSVLSNITDEET